MGWHTNLNKDDRFNVIVLIMMNKCTIGSEIGQPNNINDKYINILW